MDRGELGRFGAYIVRRLGLTFSRRELGLHDRI